MDEGFSADAAGIGAQPGLAAAADGDDLGNRRGVQVVTLAPRMFLRLEPAPLARLYAEQGPRFAEDAVCRALLDLARRLRDADGSYRRSDLGRLAAGCQGVADVAVGIGLAELATAAGHVADCAGRADPAALGATMERMLRLGRMSLAAFRNPRLPFGRG